MQKIDLHEVINKIKEYKIKHKKVFIYIWIILFIYFLLIWFAKRIETVATFPAIWVNVQDLVWHIDYDLQFEEINIEDSNWNNINWLFVDAWSWTKTVYYFHWNWWPLSYFYSEINYINNLWYSVMAYDYPWYWKSTWFPYKENVDEFSVDFYDYVKKFKKIKDEDLIVWWYSVWTAVATGFASKNNFDKLILVSPLSSRYDMAKKLFGFNLAKYLFLDDSYITKSLVANFDRPVLIVHWNNDKIVPFEQGKKVFDNYSNITDTPSLVNKYFIELDSFWHNWIIDTYWNALKLFFTDFLNNWKLKWDENYYYIDLEAKFELETINNRLEYIKSLDLENDNSLTKFVNSKISFNSKSYIPSDLESISSEYVYDSKWWSQIVRKETNDSLQRLAEAFYNEFNKKLTVVSAYRSYAYQKWIKDRWCPDNLCAKAWYSEHQSGLAIDLFEATTNKEFLSKPNLKKYFDWLNENAYKYGFANTYQKWLEIDWYEIEPWHWRYMWVELATYLREKNITFAEYYFNN